MRFTGLVTFTLVSLSHLIYAVPTPTNDLDKRYTGGPSPLPMCYFSCPPSIRNFPFAFTSGYREYEGTKYVGCAYGDGTGNLQTSDFCYYEMDGTLITRFYHSQECPRQAEAAGCNKLAPAGPREFKRAYVPRQRTEAERRIAARQYKPKKHLVEKEVSTGDAQEG